jgi:hypothetical protein
MRYRGCSILMALAVTLVLARIAQSQTSTQSLVVSGGGSVPIVQLNGRNYVDVEAFARAAKGSLSFNGSQVILTLSAAGNATASPEPATSSSAPDNGFSPSFLRAGIEGMSALREWHSALASAIENGYPVTQAGLSRYEGEATADVRLAQVAVKTNADHQGAQLIDNAHRKMKELSEKYVAMRVKMNYLATDALQHDPLNQSLVACGKALAAMAASGQYSDEASCQ